MNTRKKRREALDGIQALEHVESLHRQQLEDALVNIFEAMNGKQWSADTTDEIARVLTDDLGLRLADPELSCSFNHDHGTDSENCLSHD